MSASHQPQPWKVRVLVGFLGVGEFHLHTVDAVDTVDEEDEDEDEGDLR